ncbi:SLAP domain-containing protein [Lederbergia sp. NSJ-179]|uniref:SLAP domain-containing protein n=1 Tax=Lederbergia sp. NSJ-179 TaxID=2931402 RepID=UPI001FD42827|nr:SLAP domain-containing protein [Lederbergia sp. NSJ-179]MCJ7842586.1 SLAP domain-containing protein [Lederbergia sp. NSJ-179]
MLTIHFHPVWEEQLTEKEKDKYIQKAKSLPITKDAFTVTPIMTKYKKNGGLVATVLLHNGFDNDLHVTKQWVRVLDRTHKTIAEETFTIPLHIQAMSSQPWSFVFSNNMVFQIDADLNKVHISII